MRPADFKYYYKRIQSLATMVLVLFGVALVIFLDGIQARKDRRVLDTLVKIQHITNFFSENPVFKDHVAENGAYVYLSKNDSQLFARNKSARTQTIGILLDYSDMQQVSIAKGFDDPESKQFHVNLLELEMDTLKSIWYNGREPDEKYSHDTRYGHRVEKVAVAVRFCDELMKNTSADVVIGMDTAYLRRQLESKFGKTNKSASVPATAADHDIREKDEPERDVYDTPVPVEGARTADVITDEIGSSDDGPDAGTLKISRRLQEVRVRNDTIEIEFEGRDQSPNQMLQQPWTVHIPAKTQKVSFPSIAQLSLADYEQLHLTNADLNAVEKYEAFDIGDVIASLRSSYLYKMEKIEVFGLKFNREYLQFVLFTFLVFALYFTLQTIRRATQVMASDADYNVESVTAIFLEGTYRRFTLWVIIPSLIMLGTWNVQNVWYSAVATLLLTGAVVYLGWKCYRAFANLQVKSAHSPDKPITAS
jgi:hypothetical protein